MTFTTGNGSDADSGLDLSSASVTRKTGDLSGDSCSNFSADAGTFSSPDSAVNGGHCYRYSFTIADNAGHISAPVTATAKVDTGDPSASLTDPGTPVAGVVALNANASDATTAYDLRAVATDTVGHTHADLVANRRVDNTAPDTTIDTSPADPSNDATPTFDFSSSETGSTFQCRVDGGSWSPCSSPDTTAALGEGSHTFDVRATDQAGNTDGTAAPRTWTIDLTAPNTTIDSGPSSPSGNATPTFVFSSSEPASTFECRVDGGSWASCTSPYTTAALADGSHTFDVRATDQAGNTDGTPAGHTWTVDVTAPDTTLDSSPPSPSNDTTPTFDFSSSEPGSTFQCRVDGGSWASCTSPHTTGALGEGTHTFDVRATDAAGNTDASPASFTWTIDLTAPNTTIDSGTSGSSNDTTPAFAFSASEPPTFAFHSSEGGSTFECRVDGGAWAPCTSPHTTAALADGSHAFDVRATDTAGNTDGTPATHAWSIDLGPPAITITAPTTYVNSSDPSTYTVTATTPNADVTHVDFYGCSNASVGCSSGTWNQFDTDNTAPFAGSWATPATDGTRALRAVAVDGALNTGTDVRTITIDRTPPTGVTVSYSDGYAFGTVPVGTDNGPDADVDTSSAVLERQTGDLGNDACTNFGAWTSVTSPDTVASGKCAQYRYRVADDAGNGSTATSGNVVKSDTSAPTSAQDDPGANVRQTIALTSSAGDTGGSGLASVAFQRRSAGGGSWTTMATDNTPPFSAAHDTTADTDGLYDFRTVATDKAGNVEVAPSVVANRRIDNTAPAATMQSPGDPVRGTLVLSSTTRATRRRRRSSRPASTTRPPH